MSNKNYFLTGLTEMLILSFLKKRDFYAYEIAKNISDYSDGMLNISHNTVYAIIYRLVDNGYISEYSERVGRRRTRVYYHLQPSGAHYLAQLEDNFSSAIAAVQKIHKTLYEEED